MSFYKSKLLCQWSITKLFQLIRKTIIVFSGLPYTISEWESKELSNEKYTPLSTADKRLSPKLLWNISRIRLKLEGSCLKNLLYKKKCNKFIYFLRVRCMVTRFKRWFYFQRLLFFLSVSWLRMFIYNISHKLLRPNQFLEKFLEILECSTLQK